MQRSIRKLLIEWSLSNGSQTKDIRLCIRMNTLSTIRQSICMGGHIEELMGGRFFLHNPSIWPSWSASVETKSKVWWDSNLLFAVINLFGIYGDCSVDLVIRNTLKKARSFLCSTTARFIKARKWDSFWIKSEYLQLVLLHILHF